METKFTKAPFNLETAKKIINGEIQGRITNRCGDDVRILSFDAKGKYPIIALVFDKSLVAEAPESYTLDGRYSVETEHESNFDLILEIPEYLLFKDGDILSNPQGDFIFILCGNGTHTTSFYAALDKMGTLLIDMSGRSAACKDNIDRYRFATEEEIKKFIKKLKQSAQPSASDILKKFFNIKAPVKFTPNLQDWVLCKAEEWCLCQFSHTKVTSDGRLLYITVGGIGYEKCIPFNENTKHLVGTTQEYVDNNE